MPELNIGVPNAEMTPSMRGVEPTYLTQRSSHTTYSSIFPLSAYNMAFHQPRTPAVLGLPVERYSYRVFGKRLFDLALVVLLAPFALLLIGLSSLLLLVEGGSPFYWQARLGKGGGTFSILKLRTMVKDADQMLECHLTADPALRAEWDRTQKLKSDPRVTRIGALLRKTSLDELPQLWNVLKGEMSLVGPRPMLPEQLPFYGDAAHYFALRPGITGYWQVSKRNEGSFLSRVALDAEYNFNLSLLEDAKVLLRTFGAVVKRTGY